jgi:hypothetical protein
VRGAAPHPYGIDFEVRINSGVPQRECEQSNAGLIAKFIDPLEGIADGVIAKNYNRDPEYVRWQLR